VIARLRRAVAKHPPHPSDAVADRPLIDTGISKDQRRGLRQLVAQVPPAGSSNAIVGHGHQFQAVAGADAELAEGEAAIVKGDGKGGFKIVARIASEEWSRLPR
jgi:hypothetical protein